MMLGVPDCATEETARALGAWEPRRGEGQARGSRPVSLLSSRLKAGGRKKTWFPGKVATEAMGMDGLQPDF